MLYLKVKDVDECGNIYFESDVETVMLEAKYSMKDRKMVYKLFPMVIFNDNSRLLITAVPIVTKSFEGDVYSCISELHLELNRYACAATEHTYFINWGKQAGIIIRFDKLLSRDTGFYYSFNYCTNREDDYDRRKRYRVKFNIDKIDNNKYKVVMIDRDGVYDTDEWDKVDDKYITPMPAFFGNTLGTPLTLLIDFD